MNDKSKKLQPKDLQATSAFESGIDTDVDEGKSSNPGVGVDFGRYKIEGILGEGAMGSVYLAHDSQLDRKVALKIPKFTKTANEKILKRFYREARSAATLTHPNICQVYDVGEIDNTHYIAMAYLKGHPLSDYIVADKPIDQQTAALIIRKIALALQEAHSKGIVHRDIKPANIMIDHRREPILMDFGLAGQEETVDDQTRLTQNGAILGSPAYMSKEQLEGDTEHINHLSDMYSLGVVFFELLTSYLPFKGSGSVVSMIGEILAKQTPDPRKTNKKVDSRLAKICLKAMAKEPKDRFQSMAEMAEAIKRGLAPKQQDVSGVKLAEKAQMAKKLYQKGQYPGAITVLEEIVETGQPDAKEVKAAAADLRKLQQLLKKQESEKTQGTVTSQPADGSGSWFDDDVFGSVPQAAGLPDPSFGNAPAGVGKGSEPGDTSFTAAAPAFAVPNQKPKGSGANLKVIGPVLIAIVGTLIVAYFLFGPGAGGQSESGSDAAASQNAAAAAETASDQTDEAAETPVDPAAQPNPPTIDEQFDKLDFNGDGVINAYEVRPDMRDIVAADTNQDRDISREEYTAHREAGETSDPRGQSQRPRPRRSARAVLLETFDQLDTNSDGELSIDELPAPQRGVFQGGDTDDSGTLSVEEIKNLRQPPAGRPGGGLGGFLDRIGQPRKRAAAEGDE